MEDHALMKEIGYQENNTTCHPIGQAYEFVHATEHAMGYPIYDLTSIIYGPGLDHCSQTIEIHKQEYMDKLFYYHVHPYISRGNWEDFMLKWSMGGSRQAAMIFCFL